MGKFMPFIQIPNLSSVGNKNIIATCFGMHVRRDNPSSSCDGVLAYSISNVFSLFEYSCLPTSLTYIFESLHAGSIALLLPKNTKSFAKNAKKNPTNSRKISIARSGARFLSPDSVAPPAPFRVLFDVVKNWPRHVSACYFFYAEPWAAIYF